jgi:hypothetical protein
MICKTATTVHTTTALPGATPSVTFSPGLVEEITELVTLFMDKLQHLWNLLKPLVENIGRIAEGFSDRIRDIIKEFSGVYITCAEDHRPNLDGLGEGYHS